jgi:glutamate-ammonia-ligase adenylyltransferase
MPAARKPSKPARTLAAGLKPRLRPLTVAAARPYLAEFSGKGRGAPGLAASLKGATGRFVAAVMECSPFLRSLMLDDPARLAALLACDPKARLASLVAAGADAWRDTDQATLMTALRRGREEVALLTALADLGGIWDVTTVTAALTRYADAAVGAAVRFILARAAEAGEIEVADAEKPDEDSGWIILAMGKYGAGELNYSSDIDLIVLFDRAVIRVVGERDPTTVFVKLTKRLVAILNERTIDGYVYRTALRLRPYPGTTNNAM